MPTPREQPKPPQRVRRRKEPAPVFWHWLLFILLFGGIMIYYLDIGKPGTIDYSKFMDLAKQKQFKHVILRGGSRLIGELSDPEKLDEKLKNYVKGGKTIEAEFIDNMTEFTVKQLEGNVEYRVDKEPGSWIGPFIMFVLPTLLLIAFFVFILLPRFRDPMGGGFLGNYIKSPARRYEKAKMRVTFNDVADMASAKSELQEIVEFLKGPEKFQRLGAQIPKGVLLIGPPGTGKTLLARAVAGEAGVPFFSISGSEFIQMFVGVGASRVRDMFKTAKENAPCLLFIDEIDAVGRMRGAGVGGGSDEREQTLNQILNEMDGFTPNESVIVIAATNRPDVLDSALLRPGRFDRHVVIDRPTWQGRMAILKVHTRNKPLAEDVNLEDIARKMIGMTGADLRNLANEAAILATRDNKQRLERSDFERAADRVLMGPKREEILNEATKKQIAYHEAGHTLVAWVQPEIEAPKKVTIVPRGRAGGVTFFGIDEDRHALRSDVLPGQPGRHDGRPGRRALDLWPDFRRGRERLEASHQPGPLHGYTLGHERSAGPHVVPHWRGTRIPGKGTAGTPRFQRSHRRDHRRRSAKAVASCRSTGPRHPQGTLRRPGSPGRLSSAKGRALRGRTRADSGQASEDRRTLIQRPPRRRFLHGHGPDNVRACLRTGRERSGLSEPRP